MRPVEQIALTVNIVAAGIKTVAEARADLGLAPEGGKDGGLGKYNHNHDEQGWFATAENAVGAGGGDIETRIAHQQQPDAGTPRQATPGNQQIAAIDEGLESFGGGSPRAVRTPKGATQFIFPNGAMLRFDLEPGQYLGGQGPHINIETPDGTNIHAPLGE